MPAPISENIAKEAARKVLAIKPNGFAATDGKYIYYCGKPDRAEDVIDAAAATESQVFQDAVEAARKAVKAGRAEAFCIPMGHGNVLFYGTPDDARLIQFTVEE